MKKIKHFILPEHTNDLYDNEAISSISLTKEVASKINEIVDSYNKLSETNLEKIQEQDGKIAKGILYMKDNLLNTISDLLDLKGTELFDSSVIKYASELLNDVNTLTTRLDNLLGSVTSGSTTLDSELIDVRVGFDGKTYKNAGETVRNVLGSMYLIDSENYKTKLSDLNNATLPRYVLNFSTTTTDLPLNLPFKNVPEPLVIVENYINGSYTYQLITSKGKMYTRYKANSNWSEWTTNNTINHIITIDNYNDVLNDLDNAIDKEYFFLFKSGTSKEYLPLNMPFDVIPDNFGVLKTYNYNSYKWQEFIIKGTTYTRLYNGSVWSEWENGSTSKYVIINSENYETLCSDVNNCESDKIYILNYKEGTTEIPLNLPFKEIPDSLLYIHTYKNGYGYQEIVPANNKYLYRRMYAGGWNEWFLVYNSNTSDTTYRTNENEGILQALKNCYEKGYKKLVVEAGTYDIIEEYKNYYGENYFDTYEGYQGNSDKFSRGLWLEDIEIVFSSGAKVICNNTENNENVKTYFSAFATGNNVVIDGLVLEATNLRYGIHSDYNTGENLTTMKIVNCDLSHISDNNIQAIGGGLGIHVNWIIENTIFRSDKENMVLRIHNNVSNKAQSKVIITNCYIEGTGYFKFNSYSTSEKITNIIVSNCSFVHDVEEDFETSDSSIKNINVIKFNNEIRSN